MRRQCVPGSLFSAYERELGDEAMAIVTGPTLLRQCAEVVTANHTSAGMPMSKSTSRFCDLALQRAKIVMSFSKIYQPAT